MASQQTPHSNDNLRPKSSIVQGRYVVDCVLDSRPLVVAYRAYDLAEARFVTLEILDESLVHDAALMSRLRKESSRAKDLIHPNIVSFYGLEQDDSGVFSAREYVDGVLLQDYLTLLNRPAMFYEAMQIVDQVGSALHYAHRSGLLHQSINPRSIVLRYDGRVMVLGFGLPGLVGISSETDLDPLYLSPEQCAGGKIDYHTDIYSLAVVTYLICTGRPPFVIESAESPQNEAWDVLCKRHLLETPPFASKLNSDLPKDVSWVLSRALSKCPEERFRSTAEFVAAMKRAWHEAGLDPNAMCIEPPPWIKEPEAVIQPRSSRVSLIPAKAHLAEPSKKRIPMYWLLGLFLVVAAVWAVLLAFLLGGPEQAQSKLAFGQDAAPTELSLGYYGVPTWTPPLIPTPTGTRTALDVRLMEVSAPTIAVPAGIPFNGLRGMSSPFGWNDYVKNIKWRTYTDPRFGFALTYPEEWSVEPRQNTLRFYMQEQDVGVIVCSCGTRVADAAQWATRVQELLRKDFPGIEQLEQRIYKAGWLATLTRVPQGEEDIQMAILSFGQGQRGYAVVFVAWASDWDGAKPIFDEMALNMHFP